METEKPALSRATIGFGISLAIASIINALLVVAKELSQNGVMAWMKRLTGHHWTTQALIVLVIFVVFGLVFSRQNGGKGPAITTRRLIGIIVGGSAIGIFIIAGFCLLAG